MKQCNIELIIAILKRFGYEVASDIVQEMVEAGFDETNDCDEVERYLEALGFISDDPGANI